VLVIESPLTHTNANALISKQSFNRSRTVMNSLLSYRLSPSLLRTKHKTPFQFCSSHSHALLLIVFVFFATKTTITETETESENKQKLNECRLLKRFGDELVFSYHNNRRPDARQQGYIAI